MQKARVRGSETRWCLQPTYLSVGKVCTNGEVEPLLQPLDNERFNLRSAVTTPEARLEYKAGGFWSRGVTAFFYVKVTHVNQV